MKILPRNDWCLVLMVQLEKVESLHMPQSAIQGKEFIIEAVGPKVEGLKKGDMVLMAGKIGVDYYPLPNSPNLLVIRQEHVVLVFGEGVEE